MFYFHYLPKVRAVYTGIKKPEFFSHSGFSLEVARQLPLNTAKNLNRKTHLRSVVVWYSAGLSLVFANVNARSPLISIIQVFGHVGRDLLWIIRGPRRTAHHVQSKVERSRACAPLTKQPVWDSGFFGSVNGTTKNPGFLDFGFCRCKWAYGYSCVWMEELLNPREYVRQRERSYTIASYNCMLSIVWSSMVCINWSTPASNQHFVMSFNLSRIHV